MVDKLLLLCKYGDDTVVWEARIGASLNQLVSHLCERWTKLSRDAIRLYYPIPGHPRCFLASDCDFDGLFSVAATLGLQFIDVEVSDSGLSICGSGSDVGSSRIDNVTDDAEVDMLAGYCRHKKRTLMTVGWDRSITHVGQKFEGGVTEFRLCLQKQSLASGYGYKFVRNEPTRVTAMCPKKDSTGCDWMVHATHEPINEFFYLRKLINIHTCGAASRAYKHNRMSSNLVASLIEDQVRGKAATRPIDIVQQFTTNYGLHISYDHAWSGVDMAKKGAFGDHDESFGDLHWYARAAINANPGSCFAIEVHEDSSRFKRMFVAFKGCIDGFRYCRPLLFLDGTHLKTKFKGHLLAATAKDGNQGLFPLAFSIVDSENEVNWFWFLECLREIVSKDRIITFVSDRNAGLLKAVSFVFPRSPHAYCLFHLKQNLRDALSRRRCNGKFKDKMCYKLCECAYAPTAEHYQKKIDEFLAEGGRIAESFLLNLPREYWVNAYFKGNRYGEMCSSAAESFNSWIKNERFLPITNMVELIRTKLMQQLSDRGAVCNKWNSVICPEIDRRINASFEEARTWFVKNSTSTIFQVESNPSVSVDLEKMTCSCCKWQLNGVPCSHAIACIMASGQDLNLFVDVYFHKSSYAMSYSYPIYPVPTIDKPNHAPTDEAVILPPLSKRPPGRPRKKRIRSRGEDVRTMKCSRCGLEGNHNRKTCTEPLQ